MSNTLKALFVSAALFACSGYALADNAPAGGNPGGGKGNPQMKADAQAINQACKTDAANTGCGGEVVGKGLLKCMHAYKMAHKDYKFSEGCRDAMKQMKEDRMEMKEDRMEKKGGQKD